MDPLLLLVLAVAALVALMTVRLARRAKRTPRVPWTPEPVPPEEIELLEGAIQACLRCGSPRVRPASLSEGGIPGGGEGLAWICDRCGRRGPALSFDDPTAYRAFVLSLNEGVRPPD